MQLREKEADTRRFVEMAVALVGLLKPQGIPLLINDRVDVALAAGADGVHVITSYSIHYTKLYDRDRREHHH